MDTNNVKKLLSDLIDKVMYLVEKDRQHDQMLKKRDDKIKKSKVVYNKLLGDIKTVNERNKKLCSENVYLKKRINELNDTLLNQDTELTKCIEILEKIVK